MRGLGTPPMVLPAGHQHPPRHTVRQSVHGCWHAGLYHHAGHLRCTPRTQLQPALLTNTCSLSSFLLRKYSTTASQPSAFAAVTQQPHHQMTGMLLAVHVPHTHLTDNQLTNVSSHKVAAARPSCSQSTSFSLTHCCLARCNVHACTSLDKALCDLLCVRNQSTNQTTVPEIK